MDLFGNLKIFNMGKFLMDDEGRVCSLCNTFKIWDCFPLSKASKVWHWSSCNACNSDRRVELRKTKENYIEWATKRVHKYETIWILTTKHEVKVEVPYYDTSDLVEIWTAYHPIVKTKIWN